MSVLAAIHDTVLKLDPRLLQLGSGIVIPLVVGWLTHLHASSKLKAILNFVLSAVAGGLSVAFASNGTVLLSTWVFGILQTFITSIVSYYGLWKPTGVAGSVQQGGLGIGAPGDQSTGAGSRDDILPGGQIPTQSPEPADAQLEPSTGIAEDIAPAPAVKSTKSTKSTTKRKR